MNHRKRSLAVWLIAVLVLLAGALFAGSPGRTESVQEAMREVGTVVEGYYAAESVHQLAAREGVEMPICRCAYEVLYQGTQAGEVVPELMGRPGKDELLGTAWL